MSGADARSLTMRLAAIALLTVVLESAALAQLRLFGVNADLAPLVVAGVALTCGAMTGAGFGFALGLLVDLVFVQTVGLSSLLLLAIGYAAGRLRELRDPEGPLVPLLVGAAAAAAFVAGYALMQFLLGVDAPVSFTLVRELVTTILLDALLALPVIALVRRALVPALPVDPRPRRRRRAYTTGGLSPLHRA